MRAVVIEGYGTPDACRVREVPVPVPGPGELLVEAKAIGVNYPDILVIDGLYQIKPPLPFTPGKELAGIVAAVGSDVRAFKPGDRVLAQMEYGAYAEQAVAAADQCFKIPDAMPFETAAVMGLVYQTAWFALLDRGGYVEGETVLVTGASGGVGLAVVQLVKALGGTALAGIASPHKETVVREAGADHVIDLAADDLRESLRAQVRGVTGGKGADVIIDPVGGDVFDASLRALAWRGRLVVVGYTSGRIPSIKTNYLLVKNIAVSGLQWSDYRDRAPEQMACAQAELFRLWEDGKLRPHVMAGYPLEHFDQALDVLRERKVEGKVVLTTDH